MSRYDDYDDYERGGFQKIHSKKKNKHKGHQGRGQSEGRKWANLLNEDEVVVSVPYIPFEPVQPKIYPQPVERTPIVPQRATVTVSPEPVKFTFGPNTKTIRGVQIDLDRVDKIETIESEHNNRMTFGIKFTFTGNKGLGRIVWFNNNQRERDSSYSEIYRFGYH